MSDERQIRELLDKAAEALRSGNWAQYESFWAHESFIELIHPVFNEWLIGWETIGPKYQALLKSGLSLQSTRQFLRVRISPSGQMAWATGESLMSLSGEEPSFRLWQTFVFERIDGQWKLVHGHVSIPAEDDDLKHKDAV